MSAGLGTVLGHIPVSTSVGGTADDNVSGGQLWYSCERADWRREIVAPLVVKHNPRIRRDDLCDAVIKEAGRTTWGLLGSASMSSVVGVA